MTKFREKTLRITGIPSGTVGTRLVTLTTDSDTDEIVGIKAIRVNDGGAAYYNVGFKPQNGGQYVKDVTHVDDLVATTAVVKNGRWNDVTAPAKGQTYQVEIDFPTALSTANFELHFQTKCTISSN